MDLATFELVGGVVLAFATVRDVFDTVVVPGGSRASLRVARRSVGMLLPLWRLLRRRREVSTAFAPTVLVFSFVIWMCLLALAFGMMADALRSSFDPPLVSFAQAFYLVGSGLVTVGLSETNALGGARWIVLASGFCGLAVMTMAVTYLLVVQSSLAGRDTGILKLMTAAGDPPSAIVLLERYAQLDFQAGIADVLEHGRDWSASVAQSHSAHPSLIYFRSAGTGAGWPAALGALVDLSLVVEHLLVMPDARGRASLMRDEACGLAQELSALLALPNVKAGHLTVEDVTDVCERLEHAGYSVKLVPEIDLFITQRSRYDALVRSLADHLGQPAARFP